MQTLEQLVTTRLDELADAGRLRCLPSTEVDDLLDFASNDYLGLRRHPELVRRACEWAERWGAGSGGSRLIRGNLTPFEAVEAKIARGKRTEAALVFCSGFQANASVMPALIELLGRDCAVFSDRLNHASLHHGCLAAGVHQVRYRHNDLDHLESLLRDHRHRGKRRLILAETVFSMDGDRADVAGLAALAERYDALLYLDEAHATGLFGPDGFGLTVGHRVDVVMGTFSKALGGFGAYVACSAKLRDYLINRCAGFLYSTALPPAVWGAIDAALDVLPGLEDARTRLLAQGERVRSAFAAQGHDVCGSTTQIIPIVLGEERRTLAAAGVLEALGIAAAAVRPPTVPPGKSRLRFCLSARHGDTEVDRLIEAVRVASS